MVLDFFSQQVSVFACNNLTAYPSFCYTLASWNVLILIVEKSHMFYPYRSTSAKLHIVKKNMGTLFCVQVSNYILEENQKYRFEITHIILAVIVHSTIKG